MRDCLLTKCVVAYFAIVSLSLSSLLAQEVPKSDDESFDIEPPLLVKPWEPQSAPDDSGEDAVPLDAAKLAQRLEGAKKSAVATARLRRARLAIAPPHPSRRRLIFGLMNALSRYP